MPKKITYTYCTSRIGGVHVYNESFVLQDNQEIVGHTFTNEGLERITIVTIIKNTFEYKEEK